jgi:hypothetical protein
MLDEFNDVGEPSEEREELQEAAQEDVLTMAEKRANILKILR